ncbi:hypothetical protein KFE26_20215 [Shewanella sp. M16]|uniref:virulence factor TspB C-terminal domain-related protein n=1 Tax=Shewanella sp. M16 TaxID=2830837 RepID=UPI001BB0D406|nr:virulence factor TspB C-terminal domain-related protein [Shewanella sp. M16]MBS0044599.1 hypothetical protein [Shewanella sp. M16]
MVNRTFGNLGLHKAGFFLALFSFPLFAYTPPATPDLPLSYEFLGSNAEAESTAFYNTQCDSNNFSWRGVDWACAVGDPANPICYVKMAYHATDVNKCQDSGGTDPDSENPDPQNPDPDSLQASNPHILHPTAFTTELRDIHKDLGIVYDAILKGARQSSYTKTAINEQTSSIARDLAELTRHVDLSGDGIYTVLQEMRTDINAQTNWVSQNQMILAESKNLLKSIDSKTGSGGGTGNNYGDYMPALGYIANSVGNLSSLSNIVGNTAQIGAINNILSGSINSNLEKIAGQVGKPADNSAIIEQLVEANNGLTDIVIRMRDIENAIGKSEKSIVDAIGKGGDGTDPDSVSSTGCASFQCSSDSPSCFIARKEWERSCALSQTETDVKGLVDSLVSSVKQYNESPDSDIQNIDAGVINTDALLNKYTNANGFNAGGQQTCPAPLPLDIGIAVLHIDLSPMCDLAAVISWFVIATAMLSSGLAIAKYS